MLYSLLKTWDQIAIELNSVCMLSTRFLCWGDCNRALSMLRTKTIRWRKISKHYIISFSIHLSLSLSPSFSICLSCLCPSVSLSVGMSAWFVRSSIHCSLSVCVSICVSCLRALCVRVRGHSACLLLSLRAYSTCLGGGFYKMQPWFWA